MRPIPIGKPLTYRQLHRMTQAERNAYWEIRDPELMAALRKYATPQFELHTPKKCIKSFLELSQGAQP